MNLKRSLSRMAAWACLACALGSLPASAESLWFGGAGLEAQDLYDASNDPIELRVHFWQQVDAASLDDQDLWVVSRNGFQQMATFVRLETNPDILPIDLSADGVEPDGRLAFPPAADLGLTTAIYHVKPTAADGWTKEDNGRYVVLLEPDQIRYRWGGALEAALLGDFKIAIDEPRPAIPDEVAVKVSQSDSGEYVAHVVYQFNQGPVEVLDWGTPVQDGNHFSIDFTAVHPPGGFTDAIEMLEQDYRLPELRPGVYGIDVRSYGDYLAETRFKVAGGDERIEAKVDLRVEAIGGHQVASSVLKFADPYYALMDDGEVTQEGNAFTINVSAQKVVFVQEPDEAVFELRHDLGAPKPGAYSLTFQVNGQTIRAIRFRVDEAATEIPASAEITISREEEKVLGHVSVTIQPNDDGSIYHIGDWGQPRQEGSTIYLDATSEGPLKSLNVVPYFAEHDYLLHGEEDDEDGRPIQFKNLELIPEWLRPTKPQELVFRSNEEWNEWVTANWPPHIRAAQPGPPVNFETHMVLAVFAGEVDQGIDVSITAVTDYGSSIVADYLTSFPGILPEDPQQVRPGSMVAIPLSDLPVRFRSDIIAFPSPPPGDVFEIAAQELDPGAYTVVFRIDGVAYAKTAFEVEEERSIPAKASVEVAYANDASVSAAVEVAFTGFPYHTVSDWGPVIRQGNHFILDATANEIQFVQEPELPYFESHVYPLTLINGSEELDFKRVDLQVQKVLPENVVIQTRDEWWKLIGFEPGPLVLPAPDPVNFDEVTLIIVFAGAKPNGCHGVAIQNVVLENGVINVTYRERLPDPRELCTQAIVYPLSAVAIEKTDTPIDFIQWPAQIGGNDQAIPVDGFPGDGSGADPLPEMPAVEFPSIVARGPLYTVEFRMNGETYARTSFRGNDVFVHPQPKPLPEPFILWLNHFLPNLPADGGAAVDAEGAKRMVENQDGDRWTNFEEFLLGLNPASSNEPSAIWTDWVQDDAGVDHFAICFKRRKGATDHADFVVELSQDLQVWQPLAELVQEPIIREINADLEEVTICLPPTTNADGFPFARLAVKEKSN